MFGSIGAGSDDPGTWTVTVNGKASDITADRWDYGDNGNLRLWKGMEVVAEFQWYDSIVRKGG